MASRQQFGGSQLVNNSQTTTGSASTNVKEKSSHSNKSESAKLKHDKASSSGGGHVPLSSNTIINNMSNKRKGTSFQITSVSVSSANAHQVQRSSTDNNGDDSADDLDDSHTDDNISRITDYETPSISETFSGDDVFFTQQIAFGTAPVIPTSSQYGLAIVGPPDLGTNLTDVHVSVNDAMQINIMGPISTKQDPDHKTERFKVVKIESTEPFKRGRWMCMDYLDHTTLQDDGIDGKEGNDENTMTTKDEQLTTGPKLLIVNNGDIEHVISDNEELDHEVNNINSSNNNNLTTLLNKDTHQASSHPQTMTSIPTYIDHSPNSQSVAQSFPLGQIEKILTQEKQLTLNLHDNGSTTNSELLPQQSSTETSSNAGFNNNTSQQSIGESIVNSTQQKHAQTLTQEMIHSSIMQEQQQHSNSFHQGATLPANILMQNIDHQSQQSQVNSPNSSNALPININVIEASTLSINPENEFNAASNNSNSNQDPMTSQFQAATGDRIQNESNDNGQQTSGLATNETNNSSSNSDNITVSNENASSPSSSAGQGTIAEGGVSDMCEGASGGATTATIADDGQAIGDDNESASGTSAVAIDNKIEQAMDLVKSHLMFAVREEVEVLKEKISELMDRINQLEVENTILKANASQETLSQLQTTAATIMTPQTQTASPVVSQNPPSQPQQQINASSQQQQQQTTAPSPNTQNQTTS